MAIERRNRFDQDVTASERVDVDDCYRGTKTWYRLGDTACYLQDKSTTIG